MHQPNAMDLRTPIGLLFVLLGALLAVYGSLTADDAALFSGEAVGGKKVGDDVVVVAGVEGDVIAAGFHDGAHDVEGLIAVERGHLDGDDVFDLGEATPE